MKYDFFSPQQIHFGWGRRTELGKLAASLGNRVFLVSGSRTLERSGAINDIVSQLTDLGIARHLFSVASREPEVQDVDQLVTAFRQLQPTDQDVVVAIGGGSTIDLAKAAAALATNGHGDTVKDFLEGVGRGLQITQRPIRMIAVPTTAGTGAEATKNAVISSYDPAFKKSLRSDWMVPQVVLNDPELTVTVPRDTTAYTGMDAITQLIESYISRRAAPIPQGLCLSGLKLAVTALPVACRDGQDRAAREAMSHAAMLSGMALANSGLGLAHGVAAALGVHCHIPHGLACAVMLPTALRVNRQVREQELAQLERLFNQTSQSDAALAESFIHRIESICHEIGIPARLRDIGVNQSKIPDLVIGSKGNSMSGNPKEVSDPELTDLLQSLW